MTAAHTPGKWMAAAKPSSVVGWPIVASPTGRMIADVSIMPRAAADVTDEEWAEYYAEVQANARLLAAAPDLLASNIELRARLMAFVGAVAEMTDCGPDVDTIGRADAAIRKATEVSQ